MNWHPDTPDALIRMAEEFLEAERQREERRIQAEHDQRDWRDVQRQTEQLMVKTAAHAHAEAREWEAACLRLQAKLDGERVSRLLTNAELLELQQRLRQRR
jgi:hypothetical protein